MMCKHYNTPQGCSYGDKCQFAHGPQELRSYNPNILNGEGQIEMTKNQKNMINYKIVKCKNWEKEGSCKYGDHCTFAHGENDMRSKVENYYQMQPNIPMMYPMNMIDPMLINPQMQMINPIEQNQIQQMNHFINGQIEPNQLMFNMNPNNDFNILGIQNLNNNQSNLNTNLNQGNIDNHIQ